MSSKPFVETLQKVGASVLMKGELPPGIDLVSFFQTFDDPIEEIEAQVSAPDWDDQHADYHLAMTGLSELADLYFSERTPTAYNTELMNICHAIGRKRPAPPKKPDTTDINVPTVPNTAAPAAVAAATAAAASSDQPAAAKEQHNQQSSPRDVNVDEAPSVRRSATDGSYDQVQLELLQHQMSNVVQLVDRSAQMPTPAAQQPSIDMSARELFFQQMRGVGEIEPVEDGDFGENLLAAPEPMPNAIEPLLFGPPDVPDPVGNPQPEQPPDNGENAVPTLEPLPMERRRSRRRRRRRNSGDSLRLPRIVRPVSPPQQILQNIQNVLLEHANARERNANVEQQQQPFVPVADGLQAPEQPPQPQPQQQQQPLSVLQPLEPLPMELELEAVPVPQQEERLTDLRPAAMPLSPHVTLAVPVPQVRVGRNELDEIPMNEMNAAQPVPAVAIDISLIETAAALLPPPPPPAERTPKRSSFVPSLTSTPHVLHQSMAVPPPPPQLVDEPPQQVSHFGQRSSIRAVPAIAETPPPPPPPSDVVNVENITLDVAPERLVFGAVVMSPPDDDSATEQQHHQWQRRSGRRVLKALRAPGESALCARPLLQHVRRDGDRGGGPAAAAAEDGAVVVRQAVQTMCNMHNKRMLTLRSSAVDNTFDDVSMDGDHAIL